MVYMLLADGFEEIEALLPLDVLRRGGVDICTVGISNKTVTGAHGIQVIADISPDEITLPSQMLILPGGMPGSLHLDDAPITDRLIKETLQNDGTIAAICAAPLIFGKRGLLQNKRATCYPGFEKYLTGAILSEESVVTDGCITTARGMGVAFEFGIELLAKLTSEEKALEIAKSTQYPH